MALITFRTHGMTRAQQEDLSQAFEYLAKIIKSHEERIEALESDVTKLKAEPRVSLAQKLRSKK